MKKIILLFSGATLIALLFTACGTTQECPAYGETLAAPEIVNIA